MEDADDMDDNDEQDAANLLSLLLANCSVPELLKLLLLLFPLNFELAPVPIVLFDVDDDDGFDIVNFLN